jgi:hypothetical protein
MLLEIIKLIGIPLLAGFIGAWLSNYFAARFSYKRFQKEQWWQAKRDAYESIIRALAEIVFTTGRFIASDYSSGLSVPPVGPKRDHSLVWSLQEIASAGAYIVSAKAAETIEHLVNNGLASSMRDDLDVDPEDYRKQAEREYKVAKLALETVRAEAHRELGIG